MKMKIWIGKKFKEVTDQKLGEKSIEGKSNIDNKRQDWRLRQPLLKCTAIKQLHLFHLPLKAFLLIGNFEEGFEEMAPEGMNGKNQRKWSPFNKHTKINEPTTHQKSRLTRAISGMPDGIINRFNESVFAQGDKS